MSRRVLVFGPAYLDRVLRVDRPLVPPQFNAGPLDLSVGGKWAGESGPSTILRLTDPNDVHLEIELPEGWPKELPSRIDLDRCVFQGKGSSVHMVKGIEWQDDLGGMGAGFASALGGLLVSALGPESDPTSARIASMLAEQGIRHHPIRVPDVQADWTLLVTSGPYGDKLPVGFRGCHASLSDYPGPRDEGFDVLIVASLTNRLVRSALESVTARVRVFAPTLKNMTDTDPPLSAFADRVDLLCCNRHEWEALADRQAVAEIIPILSITDGPNGGIVRFHDPSGALRDHHEPAFPRDHPPRDTNRAGEAYASTLLTTLLDAGWQTGQVEASVIELAARRAAAAAGLVIGHEDFRFPTAEEIDDAVRLGRIG
ncbi:PfkB family carbohydrate kinase [Tautonia marina]|uniref:PfkB family carbohydrate kinase n=1 Tax=Tautonia marina TaxID=2653855 RepID=UPI001260CBC5|nr:PfkB family carbohydrate kinase [Tautonia marina]